MFVLSGSVWSFSCLVNVWFCSEHCSFSPPPPLTQTPILLNSTWTEDTRSCIFSDTALHLGKDGQAPLAAELDMQIEQKFEEFDKLAATGKTILDKEHHLTQMVGKNTHYAHTLRLSFYPLLQTPSIVLQVKERMEELRSMLGWILVHWRVQKQQWLHKRSNQESSQDNIYTEATMCPPLGEVHEQRGIYWVLVKIVLYKLTAI